MTGNPALDMSLDDLIKKARTKPAGKKAGAAKPGAGKAGGVASQQQKAGAKGKLGQQQQQQKQKQPAQKQQGLKAKGGIQKAGGAGSRTPVKAQQRPGQQRRGDVRVVPRPAAGRPAARPPPMRPVNRPPPMRPLPRQAPPRFMGPPRGYMGPGPQMMMPGMMPQQPMMMQQQPMMQAPVQQQPAQQQGNKWEKDLFDGSVVSSKTSSKLLVSNLDYKVTDEDIKELFGTVGSIKESYIHYDKNGRSLGAATVVFVAREDALTAFNRYNNVALDNKRMAIEVVEQAVPRGTFKTLSSGINVSRPQGAAAAAAAAGGSNYRGRGMPQGDMMVE